MPRARPKSQSTFERVDGVLEEPVTRHDLVDINELDINLRVSYKTILLVFVGFNVFNHAVDRFF